MNTRYSIQVHGDQTIIETFYEEQLMKFVEWSGIKVHPGTSSSYLIKRGLRLNHNGTTYEIVDVNFLVVDYKDAKDYESLDSENLASWIEIRVVIEKV